MTGIRNLKGKTAGIDATLFVAAALPTPQSAMKEYEIDGSSGDREEDHLIALQFRGSSEDPDSAQRRNHRLRLKTVDAKFGRKFPLVPNFEIPLPGKTIHEPTRNESFFVHFV